jgi:hypothetical protein
VAQRQKDIITAGISLRAWALLKRVWKPRLDSASEAQDG